MGTLARRFGRDRQAVPFGVLSPAGIRSSWRSSRPEHGSRLGVKSGGRS
jgi:hypothetical protein